MMRRSRTHTTDNHKGEGEAVDVARAATSHGLQAASTHFEDMILFLEGGRRALEGPVGGRVVGAGP